MPIARPARWLRSLCVALVLWIIISWAAAYRLTRRRHARSPEPIPARASKGYEATRLKTRDGEDLGAWYREGEDNRPSVLLLHGNGGNRGNCLATAEIFAAAGHSVFLISLRAHGDSSGDYNDFGYGASRDVEAAVEFLERRRPGRPIVIHGSSMGGAAASFASKTLARRVRGYILESPYRDLRTAVWNRVDNALPPPLDWVVYRGLLTVSPLVLPHLDQISPYESIGHVPADVPILILAGEDDRKARAHEAEAILDRVRDHGELLLFKGADHLRMMQADPVRHRRALLEFIERSTARSNDAVLWHSQNAGGTR